MKNNFAISITSKKHHMHHWHIYPLFQLIPKLQWKHMHLNNWCSQKSSSYVWNENKNLCFSGHKKKFVWLCWSCKSFMLTPSHISKYYFHWTDKHEKYLKYMKWESKKSKGITTWWKFGLPPKFWCKTIENGGKIDMIFFFIMLFSPLKIIIYIFLIKLFSPLRKNLKTFSNIFENFCRVE